MKCLYYLTSTLDSMNLITNDLHEHGVDDWFIHVVTKNELKLKKYKAHSSNYLELLDILRFGIIGTLFGIAVGLVAASLLSQARLFGPNMPMIAYVAIIFFFTLFGAWEGGLIGVAAENKKIALFHNDLESGKNLILIYTKQASEEQVRKVMEIKHPETQLVAVDASFYNPLTTLKHL